MENMKTLTINNLNKIHHSTLILGPLEWEITLTSETESGDGYNLLLVTDELDLCTIWVSNEFSVVSLGYVKMIRRWNSTEWVGWARIERMNSPEEFVRMLGNTDWKIQ